MLFLFFVVLINKICFCWFVVFLFTGKPTGRPRATFTPSKGPQESNAQGAPGASGLKPAALGPGPGPGPVPREAKNKNKRKTNSNQQTKTARPWPGRPDPSELTPVRGPATRDRSGPRSLRSLSEPFRKRSEPFQNRLNCFGTVSELFGICCRVSW